MRFLIGIIIGSGMTLFIATAVDAPTNPAISTALTRVTGLWDNLIEGTAEALFEVETSVEIPAPNPNGPSGATPPAPAMIPITRPEPEPLSEPDPTLMPSVKVPFDALIAKPAEPPIPAAVEVTAIPHVPVPFDPADAPPADAPLMAVPAATDQPGASPVWVPFHSQMSAEGFAERLTRQLEHPFSVERQGPGAYQVVFESTDPAERQALLARVQEMTGL